MEDFFASHTPGLESPPTRLFAITPDDASDVAVVTRALNVAVSGIVRITTRGGDTADIFVVAGIAFPIRATRIWQTGTTAAGIVGLC